MYCSSDKSVVIWIHFFKKKSQIYSLYKKKCVWNELKYFNLNKYILYCTSIVQKMCDHFCCCCCPQNFRIFIFYSGILKCHLLSFQKKKKKNRKSVHIHIGSEIERPLVLLNNYAYIFLWSKNLNGVPFHFLFVVVVLLFSLFSVLLLIVNKFSIIMHVILQIYFSLQTDWHQFALLWLK